MKTRAVPHIGQPVEQGVEYAVECPVERGAGVPVESGVEQGVECNNVYNPNGKPQTKPQSLRLLLHHRARMREKPGFSGVFGGNVRPGKARRGARTRRGKVRRGLSALSAFSVLDWEHGKGSPATADCPERRQGMENGQRETAAADWEAVRWDWTDRWAGGAAKDKRQVAGQAGSVMD